MTLGEKLQQQRLKLHLSTSEVAKYINRDISMYYRYEHDMSQPTPKIMTALCEILQISPGDLLDNSDVDYEANHILNIGKLDDGTLIYLKTVEPITELNETQKKRLQIYKGSIDNILKYCELSKPNRNLIDAIIETILKSQSLDN